MRKWVALGAAVAAAALVGESVAQDFLAQRQALMKDTGGQARTLTQMSRGQIPYDAAAATAAFTKMRSNVKEALGMFPAPPKAGEKSTAAPAIWEKTADFKAAGAKFDTDVAAAITVAGTGLAALGPALQKVGADCSSCHEVFRVKN